MGYGGFGSEHPDPGKNVIDHLQIKGNRKWV